MNSIVKVCTDLLELIDEKDKIIVKQSEVISSVVNENLEKENMINELMRQEEYLY